MPTKPIGAPKLPVRTTPRLPTDKALEKLNARGLMPTGRPYPNASEVKALGEAINAHYDLPSNRQNLISSIAEQQKYLSKPLGTLNSWLQKMYTPQKLLDMEARLAKMPETLPFPIEAWEDILSQPSEVGLISFLKGSFDSWFDRLYLCYLEHSGLANTKDYSYNQRVYEGSDLKALAAIWVKLVTKAYTEAEEEGMEFTPLLDNIWVHVNMVRDGLDDSNLPLVKDKYVGFTCPRCVAILENEEDRAFVERAMNFKSRVWRRMVLRSSKAFSKPDIVLDCLDTFDEEGVKELVSNPALSPETIELLQEWAMFQLTQPGQYYSDRLVALLEGLEVAGSPLNELHIRRVLAVMRFQVKTDLRSQIARIPQIARHPAIFQEILQTRDYRTWPDLAKVASGPTWLSLIARVAEADQVMQVEKLLKEATPSHLAGLTRRSFMPWLQHENKEIRLIVIRLVSSLPDGPAPELPPLPPKRKKIR